MRYLADQVVAEALQAVEALEAAHEQTGQARENLRLAQRLRDAEERRLELGLSNLIDVNIREVQAATAAQQLVDAQLAYFKALAQYTATIARPA
jgi:outer membrane protein TolC